MDGNRRWARQRGLSEGEGHSAGVDAIRPIVEHAADLGIEALSIYAFSRENWARGNDEVETLFALLEAAIRRETPDLVRQGVRVRILGRLDELPEQHALSIADALSETAGGTRMTLNVAFNYSGGPRSSTPSATASRTACRPRRSTRRPSARGCTPPTCPTSTCSSALAGSSASATS